MSSTKSSRCAIANSSNNIYENDDDEDVEMTSEISAKPMVGGSSAEVRDELSVQDGHRDSNCSSDVTTDRTSVAYSESIYAEAVDPAEIASGKAI